MKCYSAIIRGRLAEINGEFLMITHILSGALRASSPDANSHSYACTNIITEPNMKN